MNNETTKMCCVSKVQTSAQRWYVHCIGLTKFEHLSFKTNARVLCTGTGKEGNWNYSKSDWLLRKRFQFSNQSLSVLFAEVDFVAEATSKKVCLVWNSTNLFWGSYYENSTVWLHLKKPQNASPVQYAQPRYFILAILLLF